MNKFVFIQNKQNQAIREKYLFIDFFSDSKSMTFTQANRDIQTQRFIGAHFQRNLAFSSGEGGGGVHVLLWIIQSAAFGKPKLTDLGLSFVSRRNHFLIH